MAVRACKFEIFGKVQKVYFRKHTEEEATRLGLVGFCLNTDAGTVQGEVQGPAERVEAMKRWLQTKGSPKSRIDKAVFAEERDLPAATYRAFGIER